MTPLGALRQAKPGAERATRQEPVFESKFVNQGFPWPWHDAEAGWFMRLNSYMLGNKPF